MAKKKIASTQSDETRALEAMIESRDEAIRLYGDGKSYESLRIEEEIQFYQAQAGQSLIEIGKRLILIKAHEEHGAFQAIIERLGFAYRSAAYAMTAARRFSNSQSIADLGTTKMIALTVLDDDQIQTLEDGGEVAGMKIDDIDRMSVSQLKAELRKEKEQVKKEKEARKKDRGTFEQSMLQKDAKINELDMRLSGQEPPTEEQKTEKVIAAELEGLRKNLFIEIQQTRFHLGECLKIIDTAQKIKGVTYPMLEIWAKEEYGELAEFVPMLETLDEALQYVNPDRGDDDGSAA